jgi:hypothetical protein
VVLLGFAGGGLAATALLRRASGRRRERLDLYSDDGSMVSLVDGTADAEKLLPIARRILGTARGIR